LRVQNLLYVGFGGCIGCCLRYLISYYSPKLFGGNLPLGTLIVNVLGGVLIGFIMDFSAKNVGLSADLRLFLTTGLLGGLTTFSTFSYETVALCPAPEFRSTFKVSFACFIVRKLLSPDYILPRFNMSIKDALVFILTLECLVNKWSTFLCR
jgi:CrcB protein